MSKAATLGFCPFCKTALNAGASACAVCPAFETTAWEELGLWKNSVLIICFVVGPLLALGLLFMSPVLGLMVLAGSPVSYFLIRSHKKREITWATGGRRPL